MKKTFLIVGVMLAVVAAVYLWLAASIHSYDQRYADCMTAAQNRLYPEGHYWPDNAYNEAMVNCEHQAGVPTPQTTPIQSIP